MAAIRAGLFDYVWVQFYNSSCRFYDSRFDRNDGFFFEWRRWQHIPAKKVFLAGIPAAPEAAAPNDAFIEVGSLISRVLPRIKKDPLYGGVMLWSREFDHGYGNDIKDYV